MMRALRRVGSTAARCRVPLPLLAVLVALVALATVGLVLTPRTAAPATGQPALGDIARAAGCVLSEFDSDPHSNPAVSGRVDERVRADDGSYVGRRSPSTLASMHALLHGRVLVQYQPRLPAVQVAALEPLVREDPDRVLLFANTTAMRHPVAATAYLTLMTCPRVDAGTLGALRALRERRGAFRQGF